MNSKLFKGFVEHERYYPVPHRLRYDLYVYGFDLAELPDLDRRLPLFGYNRPRPVALYDADYLDAKPGSIRHKLERRLSEHIRVESIDRIMMISSPRLMGHVFNPVSFYLCYDRSGGLSGAVAEVNNTFGEKHVYVLPVRDGEGRHFPARFTAPKTFHVSPFNPMGGHYHFRFSDVRHDLDIRLELHRDGQHIMTARLQGSAHDLTSRNHLKTLVRHPFMPHLTMTRIYREAFKLRFQRKLAYHDKPVPMSAMTIRRLPATRWQQLCANLVYKHLEAAREGRLRVLAPDGKTRHYGHTDDPPQASLRVNTHRFFSRVVAGADIGFGEAYMDDEWDTEDIVGVLRFFIRNRDAVKDGNFKESLLGGLLEKLRFMARANSLRGSRRNIRRHYDLSNAFFQLFLDPSMAYSCAIFNHPGETLEAAQKNKYAEIIRKADLTGADHLLEIGCGWGGFAMEAVRRTGCRVTGITLSKEQYDLARQRVRQAGMADHIEIRLQDYRQVRGRYNKIVSIEMLEAVGHGYLRTYFECLDRLLASGGLAVIQVITIPDQRYNAYRKAHDWIQKHIFPGGLLPSLTILTHTMTRYTGLMVQQVDNIGDHYATTLAAWHRRFQANLEQVARLGFDRRFQRKWAYYLGSCEAGFRERALGNLQIVIFRAGRGG